MKRFSRCCRVQTIASVTLLSFLYVSCSTTHVAPQTILGQEAFTRELERCSEEQQWCYQTCREGDNACAASCQRDERRCTDKVEEAASQRAAEINAINARQAASGTAWSIVGGLLLVGSLVALLALVNRDENDTGGLSRR